MPRTRIVFGSSTHPRFVSKKFMDRIEDIATMLSPSVVLKEKPCIVFDIPSHQLNFMENMNTNCIYKVYCNDACLEYCEITEPISCVQYKHDQPHAEFDRICIHKEEISAEFFILMQDAKYSNVTLYKTRSVIYILAWNISWRLELREVYLNPKNSEADPYSAWFCGNPKYEICLTTYCDIPNGMEDIMKMLSMLLPRDCFQGLKCITA